MDIGPADDREVLEAQWRDLEGRIKPPIFLSWLWIGSWLDSFSPGVLIARVYCAERLVAMGLLTRKSERRRGFVDSTLTLLHQTGHESEDQVWIEYNGLLALPGYERGSLAAVVRELLDQAVCEEVHMSMLPSAASEHLISSLPAARVSFQVEGFLRDLRTLREGGKTVQEGLSPNTRQQIRRSLRRYEDKYGEARLLPAASVGDALEFFHTAGEWHRRRWRDSGFNNPLFTGFHETLIKRGFDHGSAQLFRLCVGDNNIGVFYFLVDARHVYFYLQGVREETDGKLKPGLSGHCLLMQHFLEQGKDVYDFMGGDSQYKRQLSDQCNAFGTVRVHNGAWKFRLEDSARRLRQRYLTP